MGKILALDYGKKKIGIAQTDEEQIIASGLVTVETNKIFDFINYFISKNSIEKIVIGMPKTLSDDLNLIEKDIIKFIKKIAIQLPNILIERIDERFTSKIAAQSLFLNKISKKKRKNKKLIDEISAILILQSYLEKKINNLSV